MSESNAGGLASQLEELARNHVDLANAVHKINLNYSEGSLDEVDSSIVELQNSPELDDNTVLGLGSYVGETVRRNLGGDWETDERGVAFLKNIGGSEDTAFPFSWVNERLNGEVGESITEKYESVKQQIAAAESLPEAIPVAVPAAATTPVAPVIAEPIAETPSAEPVADTPPASSQAKKKIRRVMISNDDKEILWRSPVLSFFLVAAADGNVDDQEIAGFEGMIANPAIFQSKLFRKIAKDVEPYVGSYFEELMAGDFDYQGALRETADLLDQKYPWEAETFKLSMLTMGKRVAQASGGFLGVGSKISKEEKAALVDIANTLGLRGQTDDLQVEEDEECEATPLGADEEVIARAPVLAFFVVAAADGNVDDKELADFEKLIGASSVFQSELFQKAITDMKPRLQDYLGEMATEEVDYDAELKRLAKILDEQHAEQAKAFKLSMFGLAKSIAEASGGFLGVGNKISKEEDEALKKIALTLGLSKNEDD